MEFLVLLALGWLTYRLLDWLDSPAQRRKNAPRCSADHLHAVGRCKKE